MQRSTAVWMLTFCVVVLPGLTSSADAADKEVRVPVRNVELTSKGQAVGILINAEKQPLAGKTLRVHTKSGVSSVQTDSKGKFTLKSAKGGPCKIEVEDRTYVCRLWKAGTAPPESLKVFGLVHAPDHLVRGQNYDDCGDDCGESGRFGALGRVSGGQLLGLGLLGGAVVAIVVAANNDDDGS